MNDPLGSQILGHLNQLLNPLIRLIRDRQLSGAAIPEGSGAARAFIAVTNVSHLFRRFTCTSQPKTLVAISGSLSIHKANIDCGVSLTSST